MSNKPKRLNKMFNSILALLFLGKLFLKSKFYAPNIKRLHARRTTPNFIKLNKCAKMLSKVGIRYPQYYAWFE